MTIIINGDQRIVPEGQTLLDLIHKLDLRPEQVAVERNLEVVPRKQFGDCTLAEGDSLEIVTLVGGG